MSRIDLFAALLLIPTAVGCAVDDVVEPKPEDPSWRNARGVGDDVGWRGYAVEANWESHACPSGTRCQTIDMNDDGKDDLVRFDPDGLLGPAGSAAIALSNGWDFGAMKLAGEDMCGKLDDCTVADMDGNGRPDFVRLRRGEDYFGEVEVSFANPEGFFEPGVVVAAEFCQAGQHCTVADVDGDDIADLVAFPAGGQEMVSVLYGREDQTAVVEQLDLSACADEGRSCFVTDADGDGYADIIELAIDEPAMVWRGNEEGWGAPQSWGEAGCPEGARCDVRDVDGDLHADLIVFGADQAGTVWPGGPEGFAQPVVVPELVCEGSCLTADVTGDGRLDLVTIDSEGHTRLRASQDALDRMEFHAMRLSLIRTQFRLRQTAWRLTQFELMSADLIPVPPELRSILPEAYAPELTAPASIVEATPSEPALAVPPLPQAEPWPLVAPGALDDLWLTNEVTNRRARVTQEIDVVLNAVPAPDELLTEESQLRWQSHLGRVVAARTTLYADPLAASFVADGGRCGNAVLHDRFLDDAGTPRHEGSYIARYYQALRRVDETDRLEHALPALTGIEEGLRCMSQNEIASLESAFVEAVLGTMHDLLAEGHEGLAMMVWDQALPVELLLYDAVKGVAFPMGWKLLQAQIESGALIVPEIPDPGTHFGSFVAEDDTSCSTLRCRMYNMPSPVPGGTAALSLHSLGMWGWNPLEAGRLSEIGLAPHRVLQGLVNINTLGEGDCPLSELAINDMACPSPNTCTHGPAKALLPPEPGVSPVLGAVGSPYTHFGTSRTDIPVDNGCSAGGGAPPSGMCTGPTRRGRGGKFSYDPTLDRLMQCAFETTAPSGPTLHPAPIEFDLHAGCVTGEPPADGGKDYEPKGDGDKGDPPADTASPEVTAQVHAATAAATPEVRSFLTGTDTPKMQSWGFNYAAFRTRLTGLINQARTAAGMTPMTEADIGERMRRVGERLDDPATVESMPHSPAGHRMYTSHQNQQDKIVIDEAAMGRDMEAINAANSDPAVAADMQARHMAIGLLHELVTHVMTTDMATAAELPEAWNPFVDRKSRTLHHDLSDSLGLNDRCDPDSASCHRGCGIDDARMRRMQECLDPPPTTTIDRCAIAQDYCSVREHGNLDFGVPGSCMRPSVNFPPICTTVQCADGSALAGACCGTGGGGTSGPASYPFDAPGPGPMPGDPEWGVPGVPGGWPPIVPGF